uniref:C2H2-type domain-containing protein n=1 Tax=Setaria digitata TaxID=48799 RepID=A0A915Q4B6_9BILA
MRKRKSQQLSGRKRLKQKNTSKLPSTSNCHISSGEDKESKIDDQESIIPRTIKKTGRKVPLRHLDFIANNDNETNPEVNKRTAITNCQNQLLQSSADQQTFYCSSCPSFFTSRRGMANHCKLHGANKRYKCTTCDFGCDNYKTLQIHKAFHTTVNKEVSDGIVSTNQNCNHALVIDNSAVNKNAGRGTEEMDGKTDEVITIREFACSECPFISRDQNRLQTHLLGHRRTNGFKCSLCTYMSVSAGFLKRHCELHKPQIYQWPPVYFGKRLSRTAKLASVSAECQQQQKIPEFSTVSVLTSPCSSMEQPRVTDVRKKQYGIQRPGEKYLCGFCGRHFKQYSLRLLHCAAKHSEHIAKEKYKSLLKERLNMCCRIIDTMGEIDVSRPLHHCSQCPFTCKQKSRLLRHENKHIVKAEHQCKHCTFSCRSTEVLLQHLRLHQRNSKMLQMPGRPKDLHVNGKASTSSFKVEKCSECPYTSRHICDLRTHAQMHIGKREFACGQCTYSTKRSHVLDAHLQLHMAEKAGVADVSNDVRNSEGFKSHSILRRHGKIVGKRSGHQFSSVYICRWCPYRTRICSKLFFHHRNHFRNGELRCGKCTFSTSIEARLRDHLKLHSSLSDCSSSKSAGCSRPTKPSSSEYSCQECPFTCNGYGKFWHHKQKHQKLSRFQCDLCSYSVGSNFCLMKHRQTHKESNDSEGCGTKMEKFIVMKEYSSEESITNGVGEDIIKQELKGSCTITATNELRFDSVKDGKTYQFNLNRIACKLPRLTEVRDADSLSETFRCRECPYFGTDEVLFKYHEDMHVGHRQYSCNLCTYSSLCPISLHRHLNLHFPSSSSRSAAKNRKRLLRHRYHQSPETIPSDVKVHYCTICPYKTAHEDRFQQHRLDHALHIQQRLTTSIKRAAQNACEPFVRPKIRRPEKRSDRQFTCTKCSFRCDTAIAYNIHSEKHGTKSFFNCKLCNYSSETKNVVDFHVATHHLDVPISFFYKKAITNPDGSQIKLRDDVDVKKYPRQELSCCRCDYRTFRMIEFSQHWEQIHCSRTQKTFRRIAEELRMDMKNYFPDGGGPGGYWAHLEYFSDC